MYTAGGTGNKQDMYYCVEFYTAGGINPVRARGGDPRPEGRAGFIGLHYKIFQDRALVNPCAFGAAADDAFLCPLHAG